MNRVFVKRIDISYRNIKVFYAAEGYVAKYFAEGMPEYKMECSSFCSFENLPQSIVVIPFICDILPFVWLTDTEIIVEELDSDFYHSINDFKQGYIDMYPMLNFKGKVSVRNLVDNHVKGNRHACFFSGGLDAFSTLIAHLKEKPILLFLRGNERILENSNAWEKAVSLVDDVCIKYQLEHVYIRTNFKQIFNYAELEKLVKFSRDDYFHGFQHGIAIISQAAPVAYSLGIQLVYIASSHTAKDIVTCASHPSIDNHVRFAHCSVSHDQFDMTRQDKIAYVCNYVRETKNPIILRVCFMSKEGDNCCSCEKCYRTILGIIAEGENPIYYGFKKVDLKKIERDIKREIVFRKSVLPLWIDIQKRFIENKEILKNNVDIQWIYSIDFYQINFTPKKIAKILYRKVRSLF